jgi:hypothetical protein
MQAAGYLKSPPQGKKGTRKVGAIQAALMSVNLTDEEEKKVVEFVEFLRMQRRQKKG